MGNAQATVSKNTKGEDEYNLACTFGVEQIRRECTVTLGKKKDSLLCVKYSYDKTANHNKKAISNYCIILSESGRLVISHNALLDAIAVFNQCIFPSLSFLIGQELSAMKCFRCFSNFFVLPLPLHQTNGSHKMCT